MIPQRYKAIYQLARDNATKKLTKKANVGLGSIGGKVMALVGSIIGLVVLISVVIAVEPTLTTEFNNWNASTVLPFGSLFENGTIYYLILATAVIGLMIAGAVRLGGRK